MNTPQRTVAGSARVSGFGYWTGEDVTVEFRPADADSGVVFVRGDLNPPAFIPARVENRVEIPRRTAITRGGAKVEMIEHVMAALAGLRIDNCEVWVDRMEIPGCDGSSQAFVEAIQRAGAIEQPAPRRLLPITATLRVGDDDIWVEARPADVDGLHLRVQLDYGHGSPIGRQTFELSLSPGTFIRELAPARTFLLKQEAEWMKSQGLGSRTTYQDLLVFGDDGPIDNRLRFADECVRHKMLDLVGDLALSGCELQGAVTACCSGHRLNADLVRAVLSHTGDASPAARRSA